MRCCSVAECNRAAVALGLCGKHYQRMKANGDPSLARSLRGAPFEFRFWSRVRKSASCWEWIGPKTKDGYGRLSRDGKQVRAHRASYEMRHGPIRSGMVVCHRCDNPSCVNPDHLFLGTAADNVRDMHTKGRANVPSRSGGQHWTKYKPDRIARGGTAKRSPLTDGAVLEIRRRFRDGGVTQRALAADFGTTYKNINLIVHGKTWKHLIGPGAKA